MRVAAAKVIDRFSAKSEQLARIPRDPAGTPLSGDESRAPDRQGLSDEGTSGRSAKIAPERGRFGRLDRPVELASLALNTVRELTIECGRRIAVYRLEDGYFATESLKSARLLLMVAAMFAIGPKRVVGSEWLARSPLCGGFVALSWCAAGVLLLLWV